MARPGHRLALLQSPGQIRFTELSLAWEIEHGGRTGFPRVVAVQTTLAGEVIHVGWQVCEKIGPEIGRAFSGRQPIRRAEVGRFRSSLSELTSDRIEASSIN